MPSANSPADEPNESEPSAPDESLPADDRAELDRRTQMSRAGVVSSATMTSRVLGLVREHIFAKLFGTNAISDAFVMAYRIPNLLRDLFAEGALSSAFVPTFTDYKENHGKEASFLLAQIVFSFLFVVVGGLVILGIIFAPVVVDFIAPGFDHVIERQESPTSGDATTLEQRELTIRLTRWLMPFLLLVSLAAVCRGVLNSYHRYFLPAVSPALFNLVAVVTGFGLWVAGYPPETAVYGWAAATLVGGLVQLLIQLPTLRRLGLGFRFVWAARHPGFRRILRLMGPATIGLAAVQVNILVNSILASLLQEGAATWLQLAFRLVYLPIGVIGVAVATVAAVNLGAHAAQKDLDAFRTDLVSALRVVAFLTIPAAVGLIALGEPIVRLVYEYGLFSAESTTHTALALAGYSVGLTFYSAVKILAPAFYALNSVRAPVVASLAGVAVNVIWSLLTYRRFGYTTLAVGTALASTVNFAILAIALHRSLGLSGGGATRALARMLGLATVMALGVMASNRWLEGVLGTETFIVRSVGVFGPIAVGAGIMIGGGALIRLHEARDLIAIVLRRR